MDYRDYIEGIKSKLDRLNQAAGINPGKDNTKKWDNYDSSMDMFGGIGAAGKAWMETHPQQPQEIPQIQSPNISLIFS